MLKGFHIGLKALGSQVSEPDEVWRVQDSIVSHLAFVLLLRVR